jgi:hypothetical protein
MPVKLFSDVSGGLVFALGTVRFYFKAACEATGTSLYMLHAKNYYFGDFLRFLSCDIPFFQCSQSSVMHDILPNW